MYIQSYYRSNQVKILQLMSYKSDIIIVQNNPELINHYFCYSFITVWLDALVALPVL